MSQEEMWNNLNRKRDELEEKIEKGSFIAGNLDIIERKLRNLPEAMEIRILKATLRPMIVEKEYEIVAKLDMMSNIIPSPELGEDLKKLIYLTNPKNNKNHPKCHHIGVYDITPCIIADSVRDGRYRFKIDVLLTKMEMDPHDYIEMN